MIRLPSTVTAPGRCDVATGAFPASHVAFEVTASISMRESSGNPGTWSRAWARFVYPSAFVADTVAFAVATSAASTLKGCPPFTPSNWAVSAVFSALCGAWTSLRRPRAGHPRSC